MRVISGKYGGIQLVSFKAGHIRPTTDRVKESIFNKWMRIIEGSRCLDLFAGTGSLSIEAISRGAKEVYAVEKSPAALKILAKNMEKVGVNKNEIRVVQDDVFRFLKNFSEPQGFDLIFCDPPFTEKWANDLMEALSKSSVCRPGTQIMIESGTKEEIGDFYSPLQLLDRRPFGDKAVSYFIWPV